MKLIFIVILDFFITFILIKSLLPFFNKYLISWPIYRSAHKKPLPTGAGIIFSFISSIFSTLYGWYIPIICLPISIIGFIDDRLYISKLIRYFSQIFTALLLIFISNSAFLNLLNFNSLNLILFLILVIAGVFLITAIINFFNFMDGIDGLVSSIFIFYLLYLCFTDSTNKIFLLVSLIAFLLFNWTPAKIFMGDSGSTFIGSVYVGTLLEATEIKEFILRIIIFTPLLGDAFITLILRMVNNQNIFKGHKLHLYQRLNQAGIDHAQISLLYLCLSMVICLLGFYNLLSSIIFSILVVLFGIYLNRYKAVPFNKYY